MADIATLGFRADSDELAKASKQLDSVSASAAKAETASAKLTQAIDKQATQASKATASQRAVEAATAAVAGQTATATAQVQANTAAATKNAAASKSMAATQKAAASSSAAMGLSAKQQAAAMRMLPAQITDIVTSLISGQPAYLVAIQQGGQLKDSFGGISGAGRALASVITPMRLLITGLAGAVGTAAFGFVQGTREASELQRALIVTGGAAGVTAGQLNLIAAAQDNIAGTRANAAEVLGQLVATGRVFGEELPASLQATIAAQRQLGMETEDTVKAFAELGKDPVRATEKFNEVMHYVTLEVYEQIAALERQGKTVEAGKLAQKAFADALNQRAPEMEQKIGAIERAWQKVRDTIAKAGDAVRGFGRGESPEEELARLQAERGTRPMNSTVRWGRGYRTFDDSREVELQAIVDQTRKQAELEAQIKATDAAAIEAEKALTRMRDAALPKEGQLQKAMEAYQRLVDIKAKAGKPVPAAQQAADRALIVEGIFGKPETIQSKLSAIERSVAATTAAVSRADAELEQKHSAGLVSDNEYYAQRIQNVESLTAAQITALQAENAVLAAESAFGEKRRSNQEKIAANIARIGMLQADAAATATLLGREQEIQADRIARSLDQARASAQAYLETLARAYQREAEDFGKGPQARRYTAGVNAETDRHQSRKDQIELDRIANPGQAAQFDQLLKVEEEYHQKRLALWDQSYVQIEARTQNFTDGFNEVVLSYVDSTRNLGAALANDLLGAIDSATTATSQLAAETLLWGGGGVEAAKAIARSLITDMLSSMIRVGAQYAINAALQQAGILKTTAVGAAAAQTSAASQASANAAIAASAAPAAAATSLATFGANLGPALLAIAGVYAASRIFTNGFKEGGYTGGGSRSAVAGVVHGREFVSHSEATRNNRPLLEHLNRGGSARDFIGEQARHRPIDEWDGGRGGSQPPPQVHVQSPPVKLRVNNMLDRKEILSVLDTDDGEQILMNRIGRNMNQIRMRMSEG